MAPGLTSAGGIIPVDLEQDSAVVITNK